MKKTWIFILALACLAAIGYYLYKLHTSRLTHDYEQVVQEYHLTIDSLTRALNEFEPQIDTVNVYVDRIVERKVVVVQELVTMPAIDQVVLFDSITGDKYRPSRIIVDSSLVITPMPRITAALEVMVVADLLSQENELLYEKINLQDGKIETLVAINKKHEEIIYVQNAVIHQVETQNKNLKEVNKWLGYGVGALIFMVLVK